MVTDIEIQLECVILIASPLQQWFCQRTLKLLYTFIACLVSGVCVCVWWGGLRKDGYSNLRLLQTNHKNCVQRTEKWHQFFTCRVLLFGVAEIDFAPRPSKCCPRGLPYHSVAGEWCG
jgi:hypothetical protein